MPNDPPIIISGGSVTIDIGGGVSSYSMKSEGIYSKPGKKITRVLITTGNGVKIEQPIWDNNVTVTIEIDDDRAATSSP